jgi:hypothetical protein
MIFANLGRMAPREREGVSNGFVVKLVMPGLVPAFAKASADLH